MSERVTRKLACDQCRRLARCDQTMLRLQTNVLSGHGYVGVPGGALDLHACSVACALKLLPRFERTTCALPKVKPVRVKPAVGPVPAK